MKKSAPETIYNETSLDRPIIEANPSIPEKINQTAEIIEVEEVKKSIQLENELRDVQKELKITESRLSLGLASANDLDELRKNESKILESISERAIAMDEIQGQEDMNLEARFEKGKKNLEATYESAESNEQRIDALVNLMDSDQMTKLIKAGVISKEEIGDLKDEIVSKLSNIESKDDFVERGFELIEPLMRKVLDPENIRLQFISDAIRVRPNGLINYNFPNHDNSGELNIHIAYARDKDTLAIGSIVLQDLKALADIIENNEKITQISGRSHVISKNYKFFKRKGFELESIEEDQREQHWHNDKRPILHATISREAFLKNFGGKK